MKHWKSKWHNVITTNGTRLGIGLFILIIIAAIIYRISN